MQGRMAIAIGNPLDSNQIVTKGEVTGNHVSLTDGNFVQTQAPINPGNSGGPLIDADTGYVIGINTAMMQGANSVGFAIPIGDVIRDYRQFQATNSYQYPKFPPITIDLVPMQDLQRLGLIEQIENRYPHIFNETNALLQVSDAKPQDADDSVFKPGDIILAVNGQVIGTQYFEYQRIVQNHETVTVDVIRNHQIVSLKQSYPIEGIRRIRESANFVLASGLLFEQDVPRSTWASTGTGGISSVVRLVGVALRNSELGLATGNIPPPQSILVGININGKDYAIKTLFDLKMAFRENPGAEAMRMDVRAAMLYKDDNGNLKPLHSSRGQLILNPTITTHVLPITEVYTPNDFSLRNFINQYSFEPNARGTRDLNWWIAKTRAQRGYLNGPVRDACASVLAGEEVKSPN